MNTDFVYRALVGMKLDLFTRRIYRNKLRIIMFHGIMEDALPLDCWWLLKRSKFIQQIEYLSKHFEFLSLDQALSSSCLPKHSCVLTFDDGYKSILTLVYPLLKDRGIPFTVYITTGPVSRNELIWTDDVFLALETADAALTEHFGLGSNTKDREFKMSFLSRLKKMDYSKRNAIVAEILDLNTKPPTSFLGVNPFEMLTVEDVKTLASDPLVTIGAHTVNHEILTRMPIEQAAMEIRRSKDALEAWTGQEVLHFSYPNGEYNTALKDKVREIGFRSATRIGLRINWRKKPFELCRVGTDPTDDDTMFCAMVNGIIPFKIELKNAYRSPRSAFEHIHER
jgi:peptidoglycan/xylan/chitin deacetylase (PgdA/CDA1 family)